GQSGNQVVGERDQANDRDGDRDRPDKDRRLEDKPVPEWPALRLDNVLQRHRARQEYRHDQHNAGGAFIAHVLDDGAHAAKQRVLVGGAPAGNGYAERWDGAEGQQVQHGDIDIGDLQARSPRNDRPDHQAGAQNEQRRQVVQEGVSFLRTNDLFREQLERVGDRLQQSKAPNAVRAEPTLQPSDEASLGPDGDDHPDGDDAQNRHRANPGIDN